MAESIGPKIEVKGEQKFKQALKEIDQGLRVNKSEVEKLAAQYDKNDQSVTGLSEKNRALTDTILSQTDKVNILRQALASSAEKYGEADERTQRYQVQLNKAETELINMNRKLGENEQALDKAKRGMVSLGDALNSIIGAFGIQAPPAVSALTSKLDGVSASGAAFIGVVTGIVAGLAKLTIDTAKTADEILTLASTTGMTTDRIQELKYAAELIDIPFETVSGSMTKLIKNMDAARDGSAKQADAFRDLGIKVTGTGGKLRDSNEVFYQVIGALSRLKNETDRDAYAMEIFGKSARELNPLLNMTQKELAALFEEAHNVGYVMGEDVLEKFGQLDDAMQRFKNVGEALKSSLAEALLPILTALFEAISKIPTEVLQTLVVLGGTIVVIVSLAKAVKSVTDTTTAISGFFKGINPEAQKTTLIIIGIVAALVLLAIAIAAITGKSQDLQNSLRAAGGMAGELQASTQGVKQYAKGTDFHPGGLAIVGEQGPELVQLPRGSKVFPNGGGMGGVNNYNMNVNARDLQSVAMWAAIQERARQRGRAR